MNRGIDHVLANLEQPLDLAAVAAAAHFSPFHFHRIFKALTGETLGQFVKRVRLERALVLMSHAPQRSLTEIALACGFGSSSDFSRSFKQRYGAAPSAFDLEAYRDASRERWSQERGGFGAGERLERLPPGENPDGFEAELLDLPRRTVAYLRVPDSYREGVVVAAVERMLVWAERAGVIDNTWYGYMWDDPEVVAAADCRYDVAVEVADDFRPDGDIGRFDFPAMTVASVDVGGAIDRVQRGIDWTFGTWLPRSGLAPTDQPCFEVWRGRPFADGMEHFAVDMHLPVAHG